MERNVGKWPVSLPLLSPLPGQNNNQSDLPHLHVAQQQALTAVLQYCSAVKQSAVKGLQCHLGNGSH